MNYTKKHKLPQWEKSDRVLMEDFNQMCASLERDLETLGGGIDAVRKDAGDELRAMLFRSAYNHYALLAEREEMPRQIGVFCQKLEGNTLPDNVTGMVQADGRAWTGRGGAGFTGEELKQAATETPMNINTASSMYQNLSVTFTAPGAALLRSVNCYSAYTSGANSRCKMRATLTDTTTGATVKVISVDTTLDGGANASLIFNFIFNVGLTAGHRYRLDVLPEISTFTKMTMSVKEHSLAGFYIIGTELPAAEVTRTLASGEESLGGLAVVRYTTVGAVSTPTLEWDGKVCSPSKTRSITDGAGRSLREAVFRRDTTVPANSSLKLMLNCKNQGEVFLYNWGTILI